MTIRAHVDNPELILSTIAVHAIFVVFSRIAKKIIDSSMTGILNLVVTEILASFMFVACVFEKGLWFQHVNETYFHVATAAQCIFWGLYLPGAGNPLPIIGSHGLPTMLCVFPFQVLGGLSGARFMKSVFWPLGMTLFHGNMHDPGCTNTMNTDMTSAATIETLLVLLLSLAPLLEAAIGKSSGLGADNVVMVSQSVLVAFVVKTYIGVTGAMMNPLLAIVVNFGCVNSLEHLANHALVYWAGPVVVAVVLAALQRDGSLKVKSD